MNFHSVQENFFKIIHEEVCQGVSVVALAGVDGSSAVLIQHQQILVLVDDLKRQLCRRQARAELFILGRKTENISCVHNAAHRDLLAVKHYSVFHKFQMLEKGDREPDTAEQYLFYGLAVLCLRDGISHL